MSDNHSVINDYIDVPENFVPLLVLDFSLHTAHRVLITKSLYRLAGETAAGAFG